jgi:general L-amino acid transport system substrate-binding protein
VNSSGLPGFATVDSSNNWAGIDIDLCRAVAAALLGDATKVKYTPLNAKERFTALQSGEIDVLSRNTTWTSSRDSALGLNFPAVNYYDGQGFMAKKELGVTSALELDGASVCVQSGTTTELNLADYFRANNMKFNPVVFENNDEVNKAYEAGRCDVLTTDQSGLYATRVKTANPDEHVILPEVISKEPLGPAVRQGDDEWNDIVRWSFYAMLQAEEFGITSENVEKVKAESTNPDVQRFLGVIEEKGKELGLPNDFAVVVIKQVGNYADSFNRNVGPDTPLKIERGLNALWKDGGLMYNPPFR